MLRNSVGKHAGCIQPSVPFTAPRWCCRGLSMILHRLIHGWCHQLFVGRLPSFAGVSPAHLLPTHWHPYLGPWSYFWDFFGPILLWKNSCRQHHFLHLEGMKIEASIPVKRCNTTSYGQGVHGATVSATVKSHGCHCCHVDARYLTWFHANRYINIAQWSSLHAKKPWLLNHHQ